MKHLNLIFNVVICGCLVFILMFLSKVNTKPSTGLDTSALNSFQRKLDSIQQVEKNIIHKIDSLNLTRTKLVTHYETTTLHYDTLRVVIDSMPDAEALYFLLSKSRQLTRKGVE